MYFVRTATALIVRGWEALDEEVFPWHATLFSHENGSWNFFCGGTLIAESIILTAGHCVWKTDPSTVRVNIFINVSEATAQSTRPLGRKMETL